MSGVCLGSLLTRLCAVQKVSGGYTLRPPVLAIVDGVNGILGRLLARVTTGESLLSYDTVHVSTLPINTRTHGRRSLQDSTLVHVLVHKQHHCRTVIKPAWMPEAPISLKVSTP